MKRSFQMMLLLLFVNLIFAGCKQEVEKKEVPRVPAWAKEAVWYQIFPERFRNGDESNDPKPEDMEGAWPYFIPENWETKSWTSDWYDLAKWEEATELDFYGDCGLRRYGGDIQGIIDKLDYLKDLGVTALYLNPVFEAPSLHKYDATMYRHIDNNFGPNPEKDEEIWSVEDPGNPDSWHWTTADTLFLHLIKEVHARGMKIIIDGVFNHTGTQFWAFKDIVENQEQSKYKDWYTIVKYDDPNTEENEFEYEGWLGVKDLPEIKEDSLGLVEEPSNHVKAIVQRWMDPNNDGDPSDGIDGWRLDVAEMVELEFWREFRTWVKEINPDAYITGEIWWHHWDKNEMMNAASWLQGDAFDAVMNYRFTRALKKMVVDDELGVPVSGFVDTLNTLATDYHPENLMVLMNLLSSHDVDRMASIIVNPDHWYDHDASAKDNDDYDVRKPNEAERKMQKLMIGIQMTLPGAPMIYYGDEAGMWGGDDPDCRKPMVWEEFTYDTEDSHPFGKNRASDEVTFDNDLFDYYKKMISIRKANTPLTLGDINYVIIDDESEILVYRRSTGDEEMYVLVNNKNENDEVVLERDNIINVPSAVTNLVSGEKIANTDGKLTIELEPYGIAILK